MGRLRGGRRVDAAFVWPLLLMKFTTFFPSWLRRRSWLAAVALAVGLPGLALAQDRTQPLIELLVRKGIINDAEAAELRAELDATAPAAPAPAAPAAAPASKLALGGAVKELRLAGDLRLRHETQTQQATPGGAETRRVRERFRLRFGTDVTLQRGWTTGFALETGSAADSGNQTFQNGFDDFELFLARAYVGYKFNDHWRFVGGKQRNPFVSNELMWDGDIHPQGLAQLFQREVGEGGTLELKAAQFIVDDRNEARAGPEGDDAWMFMQQAVYRLAAAERRPELEVAPGLLLYNDSRVDGQGAAAAFEGTTRYLTLLNLPAAVAWKGVGANPKSELRLYGELTYNFEADNRVYVAYGAPRAFDSDPLAWLAGVVYQTGGGRDAGTWAMRAEYRSIGLGSLDPNINDSDFAGSSLNQRGVRLGLVYNLTEFAALAATYYRTRAIQEGLPALAVAALHESEVLFLDLSVRF